LEPAQRYERARPGELIYIDAKKLGRIHDGAGRRFTGKSGQRNAAGKLTDAAGVRRLQVGWEYVHIAIDDATRLAYVEVLPHEKAITAVGFLRRAVTHFASYGSPPRVIRTMLGGWAYGAIYRSCAERNAALAGWLDYYNRRRPHGALSHKPPIARLNELNNLLGSYT
jgi:transposase InsO family protein